MTDVGAAILSHYLCQATQKHRKGNLNLMNSVELIFPRTLHKVASCVDRSLLPLAVAVIPFSGLIVCLLGFWLTIAAPTEIRGVETNVLFTVQKTLAGAELYTNPSDLPFDVAAILTALLSHLQISLRNPWHLTLGTMAISVIARSVSIGCSLLSFLLLYHLQVRTLRIPHRVAIVATAFAFASCSPWLFLARPDALMDLFLISAIAALFRIERVEGIPQFLWLTISILLCTRCHCC